MQEFYFALLGDEVKLPLYVTGCGSSDPEHHCVRPSGLGYHQVIYTAGGEGVLKLDGEEYRIPKGFGFFLPAYCPHDYQAKEGTVWETHWITFAGTAAEEILGNLNLSKPTVFKTNDISSLERIWEKIMKSIRSSNIHAGYRNSSLLYSFLVELNRLTSCPASPRENRRMEQLKTIIDYIDRNYASDVTLHDLSKIVNLSPQYICRIFRECMNMRPFEHLTQKRVFEAKNLLLNTQMSINDVSKSVGYNDCSYFCAVFKKQENVSPAEYRSMYADRKKNFADRRAAAV